MPLAVHHTICYPVTGIYQIYDSSTFWQNKSKFVEARQELDLTSFLFENWDTYGAEPPNYLARQTGAKVLNMLERASLAPARLMPSAEGGIALSFVNNHKRAVIEIYNTGELAAATYSHEGEPEVWELEANDDPILRTIDQIRVHLAA